MTMVRHVFIYFICKNADIFVDIIFLCDDRRVSTFAALSWQLVAGRVSREDGWHSKVLTPDGEKKFAVQYF